MARYKKKPVVVEAVQFSADTWSEVCGFLQGESAISEDNPGYYIDDDGNRSENIESRTAIKVKTAQSQWVEVREGEWIIAEGPAHPGRYYPCDNDIFMKTYDPAGVTS